MKRSLLHIVAYNMVFICSLSAAGAQTDPQLADRAAIAEQVARYSYAADGKDLDAFIALFTEDAVWQSIPPGTEEPSIIMKSRDEIRKFSQDLYQRNADIRTGHHQSGLLFTELTVNTAKTQNMILVTQQGPEDEAPRITASGVYYDSWRKTDSGWLIAARTLRMVPLSLTMK